MERVGWRKRQGVEVSTNPKWARRCTRRSFESLPVCPKEAVGPASPLVGFGEGGKVQAGENLGRVLVKEDFEERGVGVGGT